MRGCGCGDLLQPVCQVGSLCFVVVVGGARGGREGGRRRLVEALHAPPAPPSNWSHLETFLFLYPDLKRASERGPAGLV